MIKRTEKINIIISMLEKNGMEAISKELDSIFTKAEYEEKQEAPPPIAKPLAAISTMLSDLRGLQEEDLRSAPDHIKELSNNTVKSLKVLVAALNKEVKEEQEQVKEEEQVKEGPPSKSPMETLKDQGK